MTLMMQIEKLLPPLRPTQPWTVVFENGDTLRVPEQIVLDETLVRGLSLDEDAMAELRVAAAFASLKEKTIALLTARMLSGGQLAEKLTGKGATPEQAAELVAWAERVGLVNEPEYAKSVVRHFKSRGYGIYRIKNELYRRKVPRCHWEDALAELGDTEEAIDRFLEAKLPDASDRKQCKRASDALSRRGFSWQEIADGIERLRRTQEIADG